MQLYPGWSARDNYAQQGKKKKRKRDKSQGKHVKYYGIGAMVRELASHQSGPGLIPRPGIIWELSLLVFALFLGFSPDSPDFFNSTMIEDPYENQLRLK